jgi:DNA-binding GntR family transcriptional regulator
MFEAMAELEATCVRLAARRMSEPERQSFRRAHEACRKPAAKGDSDAYFELNERFHQALYDGSHNAFLAEQARALQRRLRPYRRLQLRFPARLEQSYSEHEKIAEAVCAGDAERAAESMRGHVTVQGERFGDLVAALGSLQRAS